MKKKILIFGAYGNLGTAFYQIMRNKYRIYRVGRGKNSQIVNSRLGNCKKIIENVNPDFILNLISETNVEKCERNFNLSKKLNFEYPKNILFSMKGLSKKTKLIHISTDQVYSKIKFPLKNKEIDAKPINVYGKTKVQGEKLVQKKHIVLRINYIGKTRVKGKKFLCDWIFDSVINKKKIVGYKNIYFNPLNISSLCLIIEKIFLKKIKSGVYNLGSSGLISKYDLIKMFVKKFDKNKKVLLLKKEYNHNKNKARRPLNMLMNTSKLQRCANIKFPKVLKEVKKTISEF